MKLNDINFLTRETRSRIRLGYAIVGFLLAFLLAFQWGTDHGEGGDSKHLSGTHSVMAEVPTPTPMPPFDQQHEEESDEVSDLDKPKEKDKSETKTEFDKAADAPNNPPFDEADAASHTDASPAKDGMTQGREELPKGQSHVPKTNTNPNVTPTGTQQGASSDSGKRSITTERWQPTDPSELAKYPQLNDPVNGQYGQILESSKGGMQFPRYLLESMADYEELGRLGCIVVYDGLRCVQVGMLDVSDWRLGQVSDWKKQMPKYSQRGSLLTHNEPKVVARLREVLDRCTSLSRVNSRLYVIVPHHIDNQILAAQKIACEEAKWPCDGSVITIGSIQPSNGGIDYRISKMVNVKTREGLSIKVSGR